MDRLQAQFLTRAMSYAVELRASHNAETADLVLMLASGLCASGNIHKGCSHFLAEEKMYELSNDLFANLEIQPGSLEVALNTLRAMISNIPGSNLDAESALRR